MKRTPATNASNTPQRDLKSIDTEQIAVNIVKRVSGNDLGRVLQGVTAFTQCFDAADQYEVTIRVDKLITKEESGNAENQQSARVV